MNAYNFLIVPLQALSSPWDGDVLDYTVEKQMEGTWTPVISTEQNCHTILDF
jgi:hypothetical protein